MKDIISDCSDQYNFESAANQREVCLVKLQQRAMESKGVTTIEFRELGIMSPAARIMELREKDHNIVTRKAKITTPTCVKAVAEYVLLPSANKEI